jgi:hypothetical protein
VVHYKGTGASLNDVVGGQVAIRRIRRDLARWQKVIAAAYIRGD